MTVMVGYSDSNKDGGIVVGALGAAAGTGGHGRARPSDHGITDHGFFHGRGGTVSAAVVARSHARPMEAIAGGHRRSAEGCGSPSRAK